MVSSGDNEIDGITVFYLLDNKKVNANKHLEPRVEPFRSVGLSGEKRAVAHMAMLRKKLIDDGD